MTGIYVHGYYRGVVYAKHRANNTVRERFKLQQPKKFYPLKPSRTYSTAKSKCHYLAHIIPKPRTKIPPPVPIK